MKGSPSTTSRRQFLATAATAIGFPTIIPSSALGLGSRPAPSQRLNVGLIGYGTIATDWTGNFLRDDRIQVVAVADPMKKYGHYGYKGEKTGGREAARERVDGYYSKDGRKPSKVCTPYIDFRDMLDKEDIDVVQVSTPDHWHAYMAMYASAKGKHIYGQKPLALTIEEGRRMTTAVTKSGVTWQTGSQQRSDMKFRMACEFVRNGRIGKLKRVRVGLPGGHTDWNQMGSQQAPAPLPPDFDWQLWLGPAPEIEYRPALLPLNWRHNYNFSGGMITDFGAHHIDIAHWGMDVERTGPVSMKNIRGEVPAPTEFYNTATKFHFECQYANGVELLVTDSSEKTMPEVEGNAAAGKNFDHTGIFFEGENGKWIWVNRDRLAANPADVFKQVIEPGEVHLYESKDHTANFIDCIYSGKPTAAPIEIAHRTITVSHLANIALRLGKSSLEWNPQTEKSADDKVNSMLKREWRKPWTL